MLNLNEKLSYLTRGRVLNKIKFAFFLILFIFIFAPSCFASSNVLINEFSSDNGTDWVELYNNSSESVDLSQYYLKDESNNSKSLDCNLTKKEFYYINWSNRLNKAGDRIFLKKGDVVVDCVAYGNASFCDGKENVDLKKLEPGEYARRDPEGNGGWAIFTDNTKADNSQCIKPSPSPSPSSSPSPSPKSSPSPSSSPQFSQSSPSPSPSPSLKSSTPGLTQKEEDNEEIDFTGEVFGASESSEATESADEESHSSDQLADSRDKEKFKVSLPLIISLSGAIFLGISSLPFLKPKIVKLVRKIKAFRLNG